MEVTGGAGLDAIAAHLHVPEEGLAQLDGGGVVQHIVGNEKRLWNRGRPQRLGPAGSREQRQAQGDGQQSRDLPYYQAFP